MILRDPSLLDNTSPSWLELVAAEPRLRGVEQHAQQLANANDGNLWKHYETCKGMLKRLVGWDAQRCECASSACYETAIQHVLKILEDGADRSERRRARK